VPPDSQPAVGWVEGLVADGVDDGHARHSPPVLPQSARGEDGGVFKAGVPISAVPDDGEWTIDSPSEAREASVPMSYHSAHEGSEGKDGSEAADGDAARNVPSVPPDAEPGSLQRVMDDDSPPAILRKAAEAFEPSSCDYGEMRMAPGDTCHAFETMVENGWVYAYKVNDRGDEVVAEGWIPAAILVAIDVNIDAAADHWPGREQGRRKGNQTEKYADTGKAADGGAASGPGKGRADRGRGTGSIDGRESRDGGARDWRDVRDHGKGDRKGGRKGGSRGSSKGSGRGGRR